MSTLLVRLAEYDEHPKCGLWFCHDTSTWAVVVAMSSEGCPNPQTRGEEEKETSGLEKSQKIEEGVAIGGR